MGGEHGGKVMMVMETCMMVMVVHWMGPLQIFARGHQRRLEVLWRGRLARRHIGTVMDAMRMVQRATPGRNNLDRLSMLSVQQCLDA